MVAAAARQPSNERHLIEIFAFICGMFVPSGSESVSRFVWIKCSPVTTIQCNSFHIIATISNKMKRTRTHTERYVRWKSLQILGWTLERFCHHLSGLIIWATKLPDCVFQFTKICDAKRIDVVKYSIQTNEAAWQYFSCFHNGTSNQLGATLIFTEMKCFACKNRINLDEKTRLYAHTNTATVIAVAQNFLFGMAADKMTMCQQPVCVREGVFFYFSLYIHISLLFFCGALI